MDIRERKVPSLEAYARAERSQVESQTRHYTNRTNNVTSFNQDLTLLWSLDVGAWSFPPKGFPKY